MRSLLGRFPRWWQASVTSIRVFPGEGQLFRLCRLRPRTVGWTLRRPTLVPSCPGGARPFAGHGPGLGGWLITPIFGALTRFAVGVRRPGTLLFTAPIDSLH